MPKTPPSETLQDCEFETDIIVLGYLAAIYSNGYSKAPVKKWGHEYANRLIPIGNSRVTATRTTRKIDGKVTLGVLLVIHKDEYSGGTDKVKRFIPFDELSRAVLKVQALILD